MAFVNFDYFRHEAVIGDHNGRRLLGKDFHFENGIGGMIDEFEEKLADEPKLHDVSGSELTGLEAADDGPKLALRFVGDHLQDEDVVRELVVLETCVVRLFQVVVQQVVVFAAALAFALEEDHALERQPTNHILNSDPTQLKRLKRQLTWPW